MISPAVILAKYLEDQSIFTAPSDKTVWPLYISSVPDAEDVENDVGAIYDTQGIKDGRIMSGGENIIHHGFQIRVRCVTYQDGWNKCEEVVNNFSALFDISVVIGSKTYTLQSISQVSTIMSLGLEQGTKRRYNFTINFIVTIKEN